MAARPALFDGDEEVRSVMELKYEQANGGLIGQGPRPAAKARGWLLYEAGVVFELSREYV